jgi:hypothetical protein
MAAVLPELKQTGPKWKKNKNKKKKNTVLLAKYWLWLPDDGFLVNRNILEQLS